MMAEPSTRSKKGTYTISNDDEDDAVQPAPREPTLGLTTFENNNNSIITANDHPSHPSDGHNPDPNALQESMPSLPFI